jgi:hypothetical protein
MVTIKLEAKTYLVRHYNRLIHLAVVAEEVGWAAGAAGGAL